MRVWTRVGVVLLALLVFSTVSALARQGVVGTYVKTLTADDLKAVNGVPPDRLVGRWTLVLNADGTFSVRQGETERVKGTFAQRGDEVTFSDASGEFACVGGDAPDGVYRVHQEGTSLSFEKVKDDECQGRVVALTTKPFESSK
jgi:hypothetical protein